VRTTIRTMVTRLAVLMGIGALLAMLGPVGPAAAAGSPSHHLVVEWASGDSIQVTTTDVSAAADIRGHVCETMGNDGYREAVHCADLASASLGGGTFEIWAHGQAVCQPMGGGTSLQCAGVRQFPTLYGHGYANYPKFPGQFINWDLDACGRFTFPAHTPPCPPSGSRFDSAGPHVRKTLIQGSCSEWYSASAEDTYVVLPVSASMKGPANISTLDNPGEGNDVARVCYF
jgi:hypothetical protein